MNCFININELEFSETNYTNMIKKGYKIKNNDTNAVSGVSEYIYQKVINNINLKYHFCSSIYKDAGQFKLRLLRTAKKNRKDYHMITEDGTFIYMIVVLLKEKYNNFLKDVSLNKKIIKLMFIENIIDKSILQYLNIEENKKDNYIFIKINKFYCNYIYYKIKNKKKEYKSNIIIVEQYPYNNGIFVEMLTIL